MKDEQALIPLFIPCPGLTFHGSFATMQSIGKVFRGRLKCQIITNTDTFIHMSIFMSILM